MFVQDFTMKIVSLLGSFWDLHKSDQFKQYLETTFGYCPSSAACFDCLHIAKAISGDTAKGFIGGELDGWWSVDDEGIKPVSCPNLPILLDDPKNLRGEFYPTPVLKFFEESCKITTGESFGPLFICRKTASLAFDKDGNATMVATKVIWTAKSMKEIYSPGQNKGTQ
jgi:hypothetical protein